MDLEKPPIHLGHTHVEFYITGQSLKIQNHDIRDVQKEEWCFEGEFELYKGLIHEYFRIPIYECANISQEEMDLNF